MSTMLLSEGKREENIPCLMKTSRRKGNMEITRQEIQTHRVVSQRENTV